MFLVEFKKFGLIKLKTCLIKGKSPKKPALFFYNVQSRGVPSHILEVKMAGRNYLIWIVVPLLQQYRLSKSGSHLTSKMRDGTALV